MSYSIWEETLFAVPQDSILELLLFNNFLRDQSLKQDSHYFTKYVDDVMPCVIDDDTLKNITSLSGTTRKFFNNKMKANHDKYHLLLSTRGKASIQIVNVTIKNSSAKNILRITVDKNFTFNWHRENICTKANRKLVTFTKLKNYMNLRSHISRSSLLRIILSRYATEIFKCLLLRCASLQMGCHQK